MTKINTPAKYNGVVRKHKAGWFGATEQGSDFIQLVIVTDDDQWTVWTGWLSSVKAIAFTTKQLVRTFPGFDGDFAAINSGRFVLEGTRVRVTVEEETYKEKTTLKTNWLAPEKAEGVIDLERISKIARGAVAEVKAEANAASEFDSTAVTPGEAIADGNDDVPF